MSSKGAEVCAAAVCDFLNVKHYVPIACQWTVGANVGRVASEHRRVAAQLRDTLSGVRALAATCCRSAQTRGARAPSTQPPPLAPAPRRRRRARASSSNTNQRGNRAARFRLSQPLARTSARRNARRGTGPMLKRTTGDPESASVTKVTAIGGPAGPRRPRSRRGSATAPRRRSSGPALRRTVVVPVGSERELDPQAESPWTTSVVGSRPRRQRRSLELGALGAGEEPGRDTPTSAGSPRWRDSPGFTDALREQCRHPGRSTVGGAATGRGVDGRAGGSV